MRLFVFTLLAALAAATVSADSLKDRFAAPDPDARVETWWHWLGGSAAKEGIRADIKAMGEAGIKRAHMFLAGHYREPVPLMSDAWWALFDEAIAACRENGVTLGLHNCPGWSSSGGPWITPENSMKRVTASETDTTLVAGDVTLPRPYAKLDYYRDVAVLAFPVAGDPTFVTSPVPCKVKIPKPGDTDTLVWEFAEPADVATAVFTFDEIHLSFSCVFESSADGKTWTPCGTAKQIRYRCLPTPKVLPFDRVVRDAKFIRATFTCEDSYPWIVKGPKNLVAASFTTVARVPDVDAVNSAETSFGFRPPKPGQAGTPLDPARIVDVTSSFDPATGTLRWKAPSPGTWRLCRVGYTTTASAESSSPYKGLECDKLTRRGLDAHWPNMPAKILARPGAKEVVRSMTIDSYEVGGQNWTDGFERDFKARRGYDLIPWLPAVLGYVVGDANETARFLYDFQRTVSDLFAENYFAYFTELCHKAGIQSMTEAQVGPFDPVQCNGYADVPMGEFWIDGGDPNGSPRYASGAAHLNGRKRVGAEAFTTWAKEGRFQITPHELRVHGDYGWRQGVSQFVYHSYVHQPYLNVVPGLSLGSNGTQLTRNTTWWPEMHAWTDYVQRGQTLLQATKGHAQVLLFIGECNPNARPYPTSLVREGYDFDYCGLHDVLRLEPKANGGFGVPGGEAYDVFFLGPSRYACLGVLSKVKCLLDAGCRVAGMKPLGTPTRSDDPAAWQALADEIWGGKYGDRLVTTLDALDAVRRLKVRPAAEARVGRIQAARRERNGETLYFVLNTEDKPFSGFVSFAAPQGGVPEVLDAVHATVSPAARVEMKETGRVDVWVELKSKESMFLLFPVDAVSSPRYPEATTAFPETTCRDLSSDWQVRFEGRGMQGGDALPTVRGGAQGGDALPTVRGDDHVARASSPLHFEKLTSWTESPDPALKYFAGRAFYEKRFELSAEEAAKPLVLDLGDVRELARVTLNGRDLGCLWEAPFRVSAAGALKAGENVLTLTVYNTWPNRLIGDAIARKAGAAEPRTRGVPDWVTADKPDSGTGILTWSNFGDAWRADEPLRPAGLLGPVRLIECGRGSLSCRRDSLSRQKKDGSPLSQTRQDAASTCASAAPRLRLRIGAISDDHLETTKPETHRRTKACFELFRRLGCDVVVDTGDIVNRSEVSELEWFRRCFDETFAGTDCVPFFCIANHDYNYVPKTSKNDPVNIANAWKALKMSGPNPSAVVKGYRFVNVFQNEPKPNALREAVAKAVAENEGDRPVFVVNHIPPSMTTTATDYWSSDTVRTALDPFPQVLALTGHNHESVKWAANVWQGTFTAINLGAHAEYSNKIAGEAVVLDVYADRIDVRRYEAVSGRELGADDRWSIPLPLDPKNGPYRPEARAKTFVKPALPASATCDYRVSKDGVTGTFDFSSAEPRNVASRYELAFEVQDPDGSWRSLGQLVKRAPQVTDEPDRMSYHVPAAIFDAGRPHRVTVTPMVSCALRGVGKTFTFVTPDTAQKALSFDRTAFKGVRAGVGRGKGGEVVTPDADGWFGCEGKTLLVSFPKEVEAMLYAGKRLTVVLDIAMEQPQRPNAIALWNVKPDGESEHYFGEVFYTQSGMFPTQRFAWTLGDKPFKPGDELCASLYWGGKSRFKINGLKVCVLK